VPVSVAAEAEVDAATPKAAEAVRVDPTPVAQHEVDIQPMTELIEVFLFSLNKSITLQITYLWAGVALQHFVRNNEKNYINYQENQVASHCFKCVISYTHKNKKKITKP